MLRGCAAPGPLSNSDSPSTHTRGGSMPELRHLRVFAAVAEQLSFTRAAELST